MVASACSRLPGGDRFGHGGECGRLRRRLRDDVPLVGGVGLVPRDGPRRRVRDTGRGQVRQARVPEVVEDDAAGLPPRRDTRRLACLPPFAFQLAQRLPVDVEEEPAPELPRLPQLRDDFLRAPDERHLVRGTLLHLRRPVDERDRPALLQPANRSSSPLVGIAIVQQGGYLAGRCRHAQPGPRGLRPRGKTEEVMGNATRTMTVVAALFWLSVAPSFGQTAAPTPNPCSNKNCKGNAALSGFKGKALSQCTATVIAACNASTCTCGTSGTCNGATLCTPTTTSTTTTSTTSSTTTTTTLPTGPCQCGTPDPTRLQFTTAVGSGNCGTLTTSTGVLLENLACRGLYVGGGFNSFPLPFATPDMGTSVA